MDYLKAGVKQDRLASLVNSPIHMSSLFSDHVITKVEEEIAYYEKRFSGSCHKKAACYHPCSQTTKWHQTLTRNLAH